MKALRIAAGVAAVAGVLAIAGCPLFPLAPTTPTFAGYPSNATLTGRFTFDGGAPPQTLNAEYKVPGGSRATEKATTDSLGYFYFTGAKAGDKFQIVWDDQGEKVTGTDVNTIGLYVSNVLTAESPLKDSKTAMTTMDLKWKPDPKPAPNAQVTAASTKFEFNPIPNLDATYEIAIFNAAGSAQSPKASGSPPLTVDLSSLSAGDYKYQIKFYKKGGKFNSETDFYGSTKYIAFKVQ